MRAIVGRTRALWRDRRGATAVEYGLIIALVVLAMIGALGSVADTTIDMWNDVETKIRESSQG